MIQQAVATNDAGTGVLPEPMGVLGNTIAFSVARDPRGRRLKKINQDGF